MQEGVAMNSVETLDDLCATAKIYMSQGWFWAILIFRMAFAC
jgi:hypothetical protein